MTLHSLPACKLPEELNFGNPAILHPADVIMPSKAPLAGKGVYAGDASALKDLVVGDVVRPLYPQDSPQIPHEVRV